MSRYLQLYSLQFLNRDREDLDQIYGIIQLDMCENQDVVFKRQLGHGTHHDIDPEGFVRLTGPDKPIYAEDYVLIYPKLYRGNQPGDFWHPVRAVKIYDYKKQRHLIDYDCISVLDRVGGDGKYLSSPSAFGDLCDDVLIEDVETRCGTMRVAYAVLSKSVASVLTIKLLDWRGEGSGPNIYGKVFASNTLVDNPQAKSLVFDRKRDEEMLCVQEGQYIPLQRPTNVVSMGHLLDVDICLFHKSDMGSRDDELQILKKKVCFEAKRGDTWSVITECVEISGAWCTLEIKVDWRHHFCW